MKKQITIACNCGKWDCHTCRRNRTIKEMNAYYQPKLEKLLKACKLSLIYCKAEMPNKTTDLQKILMLAIKEVENEKLGRYKTRKQNIRFNTRRC